MENEFYKFLLDQADKAHAATWKYYDTLNGKLPKNLKILSILLYANI